MYILFSYINLIIYNKRFVKLLFQSIVDKYFKLENKVSNFFKKIDKFTFMINVQFVRNQRPILLNDQNEKMLISNDIILKKHNHICFFSNYIDVISIFHIESKYPFGTIDNFYYIFFIQLFLKINFIITSFHFLYYFSSFISLILSFEISPIVNQSFVWVCS